MKTVIVCGHWASGKSTAVKEIIGLWGENNVDFRTDRLEFVEGVIEDVEQACAEGTLEIIEVEEDAEDEDEGTREIKHIGLKGKYATLLLDPEEAPSAEETGAFLERIKEDQEFKKKVEFWLHDNTVALGARQRLAREIIESRDDQSGKFRLIEMAVSTFTEPDLERDGPMWFSNPFRQTLEDNLKILEDERVDLKEDVILLYIDADFEAREWRNKNRDDPVNKGVFAAIGKDGGGFDAPGGEALRERLERELVEVHVIDNNSNKEEDRERFRREIIEKGEGIRAMLELECEGVEGGFLYGERMR